MLNLRFSFYFCFGKWAKPDISAGNGLYRICFGFFSFAFITYDVEQVFSAAVTLMDRIELKIIEIKELKEALNAK